MIDTHFHLWRRGQVRQTGVLAAPYLRRDVLWRDFAAAWAGLPLERAVGVQVGDFTEGAVEARFLADETPADLLGAVVAWAPLESPNVLADLRRLRDVPAVRGVRRTCQFEVDADFCSRPDYLRGVRLLGELGLVCDVCVRLEQVSAVPALARAAPETEIVLEHLGKPDLTRPPAGYWLRAIEELAALPNVTAKLSVVVHGPDDPPLTADAAAPFLRHLLACLGPDRLMFGSNWPVATAVTSYGAWVDLLRELVGDDRRIWSATARRVYRLAPPKDGQPYSSGLSRLH